MIPAPTQEPMSSSPRSGERRAMKILAKSIVKEMTDKGYSKTQIVSLATELLSEITSRMTIPPATD
jgi:hypothetical protein